MGNVLSVQFFPFRELTPWVARAVPRPVLMPPEFWRSGSQGCRGGGLGGTSCGPRNGRTRHELFHFVTDDELVRLNPRAPPAPTSGCDLDDIARRCYGGGPRPDYFEVIGVGRRAGRVGRAPGKHQEPRTGPFHAPAPYRTASAGYALEASLLIRAP